MLTRITRLLRGTRNPIPEFNFDPRALRTWALLLGRESAELWLSALKAGARPEGSLQRFTAERKLS